MVLLAAIIGCSAHCTASAWSAHDEFSFVQITAQSNASSNNKLTLHGSSHSSLLELGSGIPGVKSMKEQLAEAAKFTMPPPEQGYREKMIKALPVLEAECKTKPYATEDDCNNATSFLKQLIKITEGPEPTSTWHTTIRMMLGLHFWLYFPGTMYSFTVLDLDHSKGVSFEECVQVFGAQSMAKMQPLWKYLDQDSDGQMTREELHSYLRAAILIREVLPALDPVDPTADAKKCLNMARRVLNPPAAPIKRMKFYPKLLSIAGITIGAFALHCLLCTKAPRKILGVAEKPPEDQ